jgi:hypothetical protein
VLSIGRVVIEPIIKILNLVDLILFFRTRVKLKLIIKLNYMLMLDSFFVEQAQAC